MKSNTNTHIVPRSLKLALFALTWGVLLSGCVTLKRCNAKFPPSTDTTFIQSVHETSVYVPGDTVNLIVPIKCPDQDVAFLENAKLKQTIKILNGKLSSVTEIKPDTVKVTTINTVTKIKEVSKPEKYTPKIMKLSAYMFWGLLLAVIIYIVLKILKKI